jgi:serine/threonine protein kinase
MHSKRVIYRDLKLENCLVDNQGYVKLTDMGIAKMVVGKTYTVCGTADYFAPETLKQTGHNRAADWWACGVLLFIMCAGRSPFDAPEVTQIYKNIIKGMSKVKFPETFPSDLTDVIKSLCRKAPEERVTMQKGGVENLKQMPFFTKFDWDALEERQLAPPWIPGAPDEANIKAKTLSRPMDIDKGTLKAWGDSLPDL